MIYSEDDFKAKPFLAAAAIGSLLRSACLNLFLGAGVSKGFGLPAWQLLVARVLDRDSDADFVKSLAAKSDKDLAKMIDEVDTADQAYVKRVYGALYRDVGSDLLEQLQKSPLLLAVVGLLTGNNRGRITNVFTYNYDNLLEQYLEMLGYAVCVRTDPTDFAIRSDVEINHVHGFLPHDWNSGHKVPEIVLSERSYRNRRSGIDEGWSAYVEHSFYSKAALLLGLSGDDSITLDIFNRAKPRIRRKVDYNGYWLLTPDAYDRNASSARDVGMCPIRIEKEQMPAFVFAVCQAAARAPVTPPSKAKVTVGGSPAPPGVR